MPEKTQHYQLNQWEPSDSFLRADFNEDNAKLEAALTGKCEMLWGPYVGDGQEEHFISLGFTPKAVLVVSSNGNMVSGINLQGGLAVEGAPVAYKSGSTYQPVLEIAEGGFKVYYKKIGTSAQICSNSSGVTFHYIAFR